MYGSTSFFLSRSDEEHSNATPVLGPTPCSWRRAITDLAASWKTRRGTHSSSWSLSTSAVSLHSGRQATLVWSTLRYRAQCPEQAQTKTMTLVSGCLQIRNKARRRLPNCSSPAPPFRVPMPVASCQRDCRPILPVLIHRRAPQLATVLFDISPHKAHNNTKALNRRLS